MIDVSDLVGLPYKTHGRGEDGLDCFGLVWLIALRNNTPVKDPAYRGFDPSLVKLADQIGLRKTNEFEIGCVLELNNKGRLHLGYAIDKEKMIHATHSGGVMVENIVKYDVKGYWLFNGNN